MCGIVGIVGLNGGRVELEEVRRMCAVIVHRGPDDEGLYTGYHGRVGLGMRRLSIIDIESGHQPISNEDESVWVVFNGEIYNYRELRRELEGRGHTFATAADTEVIAHLYEDYGAGCVERLRGMFALALWDDRRQTLLLARDRLGIKPLYYTEAGGRLIFASELKAILQVPDVQRTLNWDAVSHLFTFLTTPPWESIIAGVRKLDPGHLLLAPMGGEPQIQQYWDVQFEPDHGRTEQETVDRLRELLDESVRLHLVSDVPLGAFLSGGIDSSSIVASMARQTNGPVKTFSIGFADQTYNELDHARIVAERFGTEHHELVLEPDVLGVVENLAWHLDEPFGDSSAIPTYMVSKLAGEHVKVVLSGDGGDELFAGYDRYLIEQQERRRTLPPALRNLLGVIGRTMPEGMRGRNRFRHLALSGPARYVDAVTLFRREEQWRLFQPEAFEHMTGVDPAANYAANRIRTNGHWLSELQYLDLKHYLPLDILTKVDRMSMAHSIETRVPLLDHKVVEFAATIPPDLLLRYGRTKYIFKRAMERVLPGSILHRPKQGFGIPLGRWFRGQLGSFVRDLLLSDTCRGRGILNPAYVERLIRLHESGRPLDLQLWTLISFELWCRTFLDRRMTHLTGSTLVPHRATVAGART